MRYQKALKREELVYLWERDSKDNNNKNKEAKVNKNIIEVEWDSKSNRLRLDNSTRVMVLVEM
jgi:hypothetical protein